jgi:PhzF family phenazine biosynthesis protein
MKLPIYQIDAFASRPFAGNPAAVMPLDAWLAPELMQNIAAENNLAETAFFVAGAAGQADFHLRWFTPELEIALCGHATLATAYVIWSHLGFARDRIVFSTEKAGLLSVTCQEEMLSLNFPAYASVMTTLPGLADALGVIPSAVLRHENYVTAIFESADMVAGLTPDFSLINKLKVEVIATAPGAGYDCDFVSRFFAPGVGVNEDPVTGSAHCRLIPYWAERLQKQTLFAKQISARGGELWCGYRGNRVDIAGYCTEVLQGQFILP